MKHCIIIEMQHTDFFYNSIIGIYKFTYSSNSSPHKTYVLQL